MDSFVSYPVSGLTVTLKIPLSIRGPERGLDVAKATQQVCDRVDNLRTYVLLPWTMTFLLCHTEDKCLEVGNRFVDHNNVLDSVFPRDWRCSESRISDSNTDSVLNE